MKFNLNDNDDFNNLFFKVNEYYPDLSDNEDYYENPGEEITNDFNEYEIVEQRKVEKEEEQKKKKAMAEMLITSGFHFDGYKIVKYSGYISGDDAISVDRGTAGVLINTAANVQSKLMDSLSVIRRNALHELKEAAYNLGCNAVIGVDFDYITLDPQTANWNGGTTYLPYVFGVTANGNAVIIEKIEDDD